MSVSGLLLVLGWFLFVVCPIAAAVVAAVAWRTRARVMTVLAVALLAVTLVVAAVLPEPAPAVVVAIAALAALVIAVTGGSPVVRLLLDRTTFDEQEGVHGGIVVGERELLRGGEVIGLLERLAVAGAIMTGFPEALAVIIAIKGVGRFTELENGAVRERFIVGTLGSWIWAAAAAGVVLLITRS
ncbi:hypothetical protein [Amnibacterium setariae]|uniref:Uncharacterized protein n=1 Tax=Amnibacterium setariae TaxID=2306585 RepID=A0A3A1UDV9_9MICO|nr:hypothetical protein [Amnibacterium setariae]RIX31266.1 hypothetical protein D1781_07905 [Amnibacterium setariae]